MSSKASSWLQELQRLSIIHALPEDVTQNVAANSSHPAYNVTSYADLQNNLELKCSMYSNSSYVSAVQRCSGLRNGKCCVSYDNLAPTVVSHFTTRLHLTVFSVLSGVFLSYDIMTYVQTRLVQKSVTSCS